MFVVIAGSNRANSRTSLIATAYAEALKTKGITDLHYISLADLNDKKITSEMFSPATVDSSIKEMQQNILIPSTHWLIVVPEYNGSFPGILKLWIDMLSITLRNETFKSKHISLVGIASGRGGNLRGLDHLTGLFHYLGSYIMPNKLPMSLIDNYLDKPTNSLNQSGIDAVNVYADEVVAYYQLNK
jgi:chromate reductase, NAD(P)H dehydrogenase (quinone)